HRRGYGRGGPVPLPGRGGQGRLEAGAGAHGRDGLPGVSGRQPGGATMGLAEREDPAQPEPHQVGERPGGVPGEPAGGTEADAAVTSAESPKPGRSTEMTSKCWASAGTTGFQELRFSPIPCNSTSGAPEPERV